jgi:hypothetical protein
MDVSGYPDMSKAQLLRTLRAERAEIQAMIDQGLPRAMEPGAAGHWTLQDVIGHVRGHDRWILDQLGGEVPRLPPMPEEVERNPYDLDARNQWIVSLSRSEQLDDLKRDGQAVFAQLHALIESMPAPQLQVRYSPNREHRLVVATRVNVPVPPWPLWRWVVSATIDHYRVHDRMLRPWLIGGWSSRKAS